MSAQVLKQAMISAAMAVLLLLGPAPSLAQISVTGGQLSRSDGVFYLSARLDVELTQVARDALRDGVPLVMVVRWRVERERRWWPWEATIIERDRRYRLRYSPLAERYRLTDRESREHRSFPSLMALLRAFGELPRLRIVHERLLKTDARYRVRLRVEPDLAALPPPMANLAYLSPGWWMASDWRSWELVP